MQKTLPHVIVVVGPTSSGKSDFAVKLALEKNGEIISADSRQIYRGLDIGTGKITKEEMRGIPHYMLDIYDVGANISVAQYVEDTLPYIEKILAKGKVPIICGGSGQYIYALIYKQDFPKIIANTILRKNLDALTTEKLVEKLEKLDPLRLKTIDKKNRVRLIRALEILLSGGTITDNTKPEKRFDAQIYTMELSRDLLREKISKRLENRLENGMLSEGKRIFDMNLTQTEVKRLGIEYVAMHAYFQNEITLEEMKNRIKTESYRYAKRQIMWNKKYFKESTLVSVK